MPAGAWLQSVWRIRKVADSLGSPSPCVPSARQGPRQLAPVAPAAPPAALQRAADPLGRDTGRHARQHGTAGPTDCTIMGPGVQAAAGGLQAPCQCSVGRGWMAARCFLLSCKLVRSASRLLPSSVAFYQWYGQLLRPVQQRHVLQFPLCRRVVAQHPIRRPRNPKFHHSPSNQRGLPAGQCNPRGHHALGRHWALLYSALIQNTCCNKNPCPPQPPR